MANKARLRILDDPRIRVATLESFESPATGRGVLLFVTKHHRDHLAIPLLQPVVVALHVLESIHREAGTPGKRSGTQALHRQRVGVHVLNADIAFGGVAIQIDRGMMVKPGAVILRKRNAAAVLGRQYSRIQHERY